MTDVFMPSMGESVKEGVIINVLVKPGDVLTRGRTLLEVETDKVTFEVPAETEGVLTEILVQTGDKIRTGDLFLRVGSNNSAEKEIDKNFIQEDAVVESSSKFVVPLVTINKDVIQPTTEFYENENVVLSLKENRKILSTPLARKLARELDIKIEEIGKSINKRISLTDVKAFAKYRLQQINDKEQKRHFDNAFLPDFEKYGTIHREPLSGIMEVTSRNVTLSASVIPHAWIQEKADITDIEAHRKKHKTKVEEAGGSLTITAMVVKAVTHTLRLFPIFNASLDSENNEIVFKNYFHIGIAVDTNRGLLVPVIRDTAQRNLTSIAKELARISKEAKDNRIKIEDLEGGTFTISNLGGIGTTCINPIINWPQVAILGLSAGRIEPVWSGSQFLPRLIMPLTLGFDHRVINGAEAARFLHNLKTVLEDPFLFIL